jgi:hypothetical protein
VRCSYLPKWTEKSFRNEPSDAELVGQREKNREVLRQLSDLAGDLCSLVARAAQPLSNAAVLKTKAQWSFTAAIEH